MPTPAMPVPGLVKSQWHGKNRRQEPLQSNAGAQLPRNLNFARALASLAGHLVTLGLVHGSMLRGRLSHSSYYLTFASVRLAKISLAQGQVKLIPLYCILHTPVIL